MSKLLDWIDANIVRFGIIIVLILIYLFVVGENDWSKRNKELTKRCYVERPRESYSCDAEQMERETMHSAAINASLNSPNGARPR